MKKMILAAVLLAVGLSFTLSENAEATCTWYGKVARIYTTNAGSYVYLAARTTLTTSSYKYFYTTDDGMQAQASAASGSRDTLLAYGNASSCPTGNGYGGVLTILYTFPNY